MENDKDEPILEHDTSRILNLAGENVYLVVKPHFLTIIPSLFLILFLIIIFLVVAIFSFLAIKSVVVVGLGILISFLVGLTLVSQTLISWFYHIYIATSRKLLEIKYSPLTGQIANEIFLDQVKCTEVDLGTSGIIKQFFDIGDVMITFDRPTHQHEFIISSVKRYRKIGALLTNKLVNKPPTEQIKPGQFWFRNKNEPSKYHFTEEINSLN